ncbi:hypothetical protein KIN20_012909 [Parelaphostrongylus tenuis]|uniref:Uncharacterized protein n=1 Tax=Parelaphostrongylus tenuis TaxID=148309 RepID=A0AAD5MXI2_PARTN|nr:hypothetical protein KIN20_012909 [Parelaphostrongylus tenuis]
MFLLSRRPGREYPREDTHVLIKAQSSSSANVFSIERAKNRISKMFTPEYDALKREQLIHLAILNGTYRQTA